MSSIKKNYMYNVMYQLLIIALPLITAPYISRVIGAEGLGIYSYSYSITQYFVLFTMMGVNNYGNRSIAETRDNKEKMQKTFWGIYYFQIFLGVFMSILFFIFLVFFCKENKYIFILQYLYLLSAILDINWFFFGIEKFKLTVIRNSIIKLGTALLIFIFVNSESDLWIYTLIMTGSMLLSQSILFVYLFKFVNFESINLSEVKKHIKPNLVLFIPVIATSVYTIMAKIMIGEITVMREVGLYEYAEKLKNIPLGFITALGTVMLPKISNMVNNGKDEDAIDSTYKSMIFALFISFALACGLASISNEFVPIFYGSEFNDCIPIINLLALTIIFIAWANVIRTQILIPYKRDKEYIISTILGAIVNIILNILLIWKYNALGAAVATLFSEMIVSLYQTFSIRNMFPLKSIVKYLIVFSLSGIVMFISVRLIANIIEIKIIALLLEIIVGAFVYISLSFLSLLCIRDKIVIEQFSKVNKSLINLKNKVC